MYIGEFVFVFVIASVASLVLVSILGWRHPRFDDVAASLVFSFVVIGLFAWGAAAWIGPGGPMLWGVSWLPMIVVGVLVALVILALAVPPSEPPVERPVETNPTRAENRPKLRTQRRLFAYGAAFWVLVVATISAAVFGEISS